MTLVKFKFPNHELEAKAYVEISDTHITTKFACKPDDPENGGIIDILAESYNRWTGDKYYEHYMGDITIDDTTYLQCFATHIDFGELDMCNHSSVATIDLVVTWKYNYHT